MADAFADATEEYPAETTAFLAHVRQRAGRRSQGQLAWAESIVSGRSGALEEAEECLRTALRLEPDCQPALEDAAWYASDRGDAASAVRLLDRLEEDPDHARTAMLRPYVDRQGAVAGRNDPCPCGSGRKYKHCCLQAATAPGARPLPERVRWVWEKLRWWLDRAGHESDVFALALAMDDDPFDDTLSFVAVLDVAASLFLFTDGAVEKFLQKRGPLLPDDERDLVAQWATTGHSVYEVTRLSVGGRVTLRDVRTGEVLAVIERHGLAAGNVGDLIFAHPVFDGQEYQFVGGLVEIPNFARDAIISVLDDHADAEDIASALGGALWTLEMEEMEREARTGASHQAQTSSRGGRHDPTRGRPLPSRRA